MNLFYRVVTCLLCFMVFNLEASTPLTIEEDLFTTCADRTASNTSRCMNDDYFNTRYGGYILFRGLENHYKLENGRFQEFLDGTARLTGRWTNIDQGDIQFDVDIQFLGRTTTAPNEPKEHACLNANTADFYYYPQTIGTLKGRNKAAGARLEVSRVGEAFQVGIGANITNKELNFGASGWLAINLTAQPTTGLILELQTSQAGGNGDININLDGNPLACLGSELTLDCPNDITTTAQLGENGKVVSWTPPVATTTCMVGNGSTCSATNLDGFEYLGEFNGSRYYCSAENNHTWLQARDRAIAAGGHLAVICSQAENDFLRQGLMADDAWIGYADYVSEGNFKWVTGDDCNYTNWSRGEPNNYGGDEDFVRILKSSGKWTDRNENYKAEYIMEIPCQGNMEPGTVVTTQVAGPAPGSIFPIGMTEVKYEAIDECGNMEMCSFKVTVEEPVDPCAGNGSPSAEVEGRNPDCGQNNGKIRFVFNDNPIRTNIEFSIDGGQTYEVNVADNSGMAMFSNLGPGTYNAFVRWGNDECAVDLGNVTLEDVRKAAGTQCDDEDATTINDVILADGCTCNGTPIGEITLVCANDIAEILQPGEDGTIITFNEPTASTTCGLDGLTIEQVEGLASGSLFPIGTTTVKYRITDACGNMEMCSFVVVIEETPLMFDLLCADDIVVTEAVEDNGVIVTFNEPSVISNCPDDQFTIIQTAGLTSGSLFPVGMTTVTFMVSDECGQVDECSFKVTVNPAPTGEITFVCNNDIEVTETVGENDGVVVTYSDPTATSTCPIGTVGITLISGLPSGSIFPVGTTTVIYEATDGCGGMERCAFIVKVNPAPTGEIFLTCAEDMTITIGSDVSTSIVEYNEPIAITSCELDGLNVTLIEGLPSGSAFPIGVNTVVYEATDACGEVERCSLTITVIQIIDPCLNDIVIENKVCNDNGTPTDPSDDTYTFDVIVMRTGGAATSYFGSYDNAFLGTAIYEADYDEVVTLGPFPAGSFTSSNTNPPVTVEGGLDINLRIADADDPNCTDVVVVESPGPCSDELPKVKVGDIVFNDANGNGVRDDGEAGIKDVFIQLLDENGEVVEFTTSGENGMYMFADLTPGDYRLLFMGQPAELIPTLKDVGDNDEKDSDIDETGLTDVFTLVTGFDDTRDAGFKPRIVEPDPARIGNQVFVDANENGKKEADEPGINGVQVKLLAENGDVVATTQTENNGNYGFSVAPGIYQVMFGTPSGFNPTNQSGNATDGVDNDSDNDPATGMTELFTVVAGEINPTIDAGFVALPDPCTADAGTLTIDVDPVELVDGSATISATPSGDAVVPNGYEVVYVLTKGTELIIEEVNVAPSFTVTMAGKFTIHTLVYEVATLDLSIVAFGLTTGFDVNSLLIQGGGDICAALDVAGAMVMVMTPTDPCDNVTDGGKIEADEDPEACGPYDAAAITNVELPSGGTGDLEYIWLSSTITCPTELTDMIPGANGSEYDPGVLTETTYFVRCARRVGCDVWIESDCVVKKVDRCDNGGPVDCDAVAATVSEGKVTITGLIGSNAKVEIIGAGTGWVPTLVCGDGGTACENPQMITDLPAGDYTVKVQLWGADGSYCYTERKVIVGGEPVCDADGGTISTNDDTTDLCVGDNEPNIVNFSATGGNGTNSAWVVTDNSGVILNPNAPSSIDFEGAGTGTCYVYYLRYENISGLEVRANIEDLTGCFDKSNRIEVARTENCGDPTCEVDGGTIATDDETTGLCVNDGEANIVNFTATGGNGTNSAWVVTDENGTILNPDAPNSIDFEGAGAGTCKVYYLRYENIEGLVAGANINDLTGCFDKSNDISIYRREDCNNEKPQCEDVVITTGNGKINLVGLSAPFAVVKIHDINAGWAIIDQCVGCEDPTTFTVPAGDYNVVVEFYEGFWDTKYCRVDVRVTVGDDSPCTDGDGDGVCFEEDCDDNNPNIGVKQAPGTSCDDGNDLTINDVIQADGCTCAGEEETSPEKEICIEREVVNTDNCQFNIIYGLYLKLEGYDEYYEVSNASFVEYTDGTAFFTATAINNTAPNIGWDIEVEFGGRTTLAQVAPKQHNCLAADVNDYYFYETLEGKLTGINDAAGASMTITRIGPAFQLGIAANITHNAFDFGGSGWFVADMLTQPTSGLPLVLNAGAQGQNGDININLSGDGTACIEGRDNNELDCANVTAIATADGITISGLTAPIEIVKIFDANWVPVENCTGDCGESMTAVAAPGNYVVRVNFYTANWIGECEVDIPVTVPASSNLNSAASSRNADNANLPQINTTTDLAAIAVFPNPATDEVFVSLKSFTGQKANIQVVNTYGQVVKQFNLDEVPTQAIRLDVSNFLNGLYYLSINLEDSNTITKKVLVNRSH